MKLLTSTHVRIDSASTVLLFSILLFLQTIVHIKYLDLPPVGFHQWRQTMTLSVARNYSEESMNFFLPRVDSRAEYSGITGMEFPLVSYSIALGYNIFGFSHILGRSVILGYSYLALIACFLLSRKLFHSPFYAFSSALFLMFSPLFCYYSCTVLPDVPSLAFMYLSLYLFLTYEESGKTLHFVYMLAAFTLAALIKIYALILVPFIVYRMTKIRHPLSRKFSLLTGLAASLFIVGAWYLYARFLSDMYHNYDFRLHSNFPYAISLIPDVLKKVFVQWLPELYMNYAQFIFFCVGVYYFKTKSSKSIHQFILLYGLTFLVYMTAFLPMFEIHDYYALPALPLLILLATEGFRHMVDWSESNRWTGRLVMILLLALPILGSIRSLSRFEGAGRPRDLMTIESHLDNVIPDKSDRIIAAGDDSPSIYLYFMHRKGWPLAEELTENQLLEMMNLGATHLVSSSRLLESKSFIAKHLVPLSEYGMFRVFALKD
jgi:4-amino-4-deoxy-L-arabinose transferase-like glycosyltransferase